jgi:hypothetical protein
MIRRGGCGRKGGRWASEELARSALSRIAASPRTTVFPTNTYECATCHLWHITSKPTMDTDNARTPDNWGKVGARKERGKRRR